MDEQVSVYIQQSYHRKCFERKYNKAIDKKKENRREEIQNRFRNNLIIEQQANLYRKQNSFSVKFQSRMLLPLSKTQKQPWSKRDIEIITRYRQRIRDIELQNLEKRLVRKQVNSIEFYNITPKDQLPKFLQKMKFQTLHSKQNVSKAVRIFKKERESHDEKSIRSKLRNQGEIMFLSEIYQNLAEPTELQKAPSSSQVSKFTQTFGTDLQEWQKSRNSSMMQKLVVLRRRNPNHEHHSYKQGRIIQQKLSELHRNNSSGGVVNYFKEGSNYKKEIQKQLEIIYYTHSSQTNQVNKYILVENSSKLLKKQLDQRQLQVQQEIKSKLKTLNQTRIEHHNLFEQRARMMLEQRQFHQQLTNKQQFGLPVSNSYFSPSSTSKNVDTRTQKRQHIQQNEVRIMKNKRMIENLENAIQGCEEELRSILVGEISYYRMSLKVGMDCRDTGLGWILKKLRALLVNNNNREKDTNHQALSITNPSVHKQQQYEFPLYLDKKSKQFLIIKTHLEDQLEQLMEQKRKFVNEIGQSSGAGGNQDNPTCRDNLNRTTLTGVSGGWLTNFTQDKVVEDETASEIPKKYRRSLRKITILNQEFAQNQSLLQLKSRKTSPSKNLDLSTNTQGLSGKKLYQTISQKIKYFDFSKAKKDRSLALKNSKLLDYQNLLKQIKEIHLKLQDLDIQHENHLTSHYKENKEVFFEQCAACFGYKKSYSMIIKYFSWKNGGEETGNHV